MERKERRPSRVELAAVATVIAVITATIMVSAGCAFDRHLPVETHATPNMPTPTMLPSTNQFQICGAVKELGATEKRRWCVTRSPMPTDPPITQRHTETLPWAGCLISAKSDDARNTCLMITPVSPTPTRGQ